MNFFKLNQIMNEQQALHVIERSGLPDYERYFIGWKEDLDSNKVVDKFADGQYGSFDDAVQFPSKDAAEEVVARIEKEDGYNVYATPLGEPDDPAQHPVFDGRW